MRVHVTVGIFTLACALWSDEGCAETSCDTVQIQEVMERNIKEQLADLTANIAETRDELRQLRRITRDRFTQAAEDGMHEDHPSHDILESKTLHLMTLAKTTEISFIQFTQRRDEITEKIRQMKKRLQNLKSLCQGNATVDCPSEIIGTDCADVMQKGGSYSGVYFIQPKPDMIPFPTYCDQETDGGGWTYVHSHVNNELDFNRSWLSYKHGFGDVDCSGVSNFWIGNEALHIITTSGHYHLRVDVTDWSDNIGYATYTTFRVSSEESQYSLHVGGYVAASSVDMRIHDGFMGHNFGHVDDIMYTSHDGMNFSTFDRDNDLYQYNCADQDGGGWWFNRCSAVNLNGRIYNKGFYKATDTLYGFDNAMIWGPWTGLWYSLKNSSMKIRPASYMN